MNYSNILELLLLEFPELEKELDENAYLQELPHCFFDIVLVQYIIKVCKEKKDVILNKMGGFLEQMAICTDEKVRELLSVSVLEPLVLEGNTISILQNYLEMETMRELSYWQKRYSNL